MAAFKAGAVENQLSHEIYDDKKAVITGKLQRRDEGRLDNIQKIREAKESSAADDENTKYFSENFNKQKQTIISALDEAKSVPKSSISSHLANVAKQIEIFNKFIADSTIYLPAHDVQKSVEAVSVLQLQLQEIQAKLIPKKKFVFKARIKETEKTPIDGTVKSLPEKKGYKVDFEIDEIAIKNFESKTIIKNGSELINKDISIANLRDCRVILHGNPSSMQVDNLKNCKIFCGPLSRSIFVNNCEDCDFVVACQQLRIHHTKNSKFFIHVTTRAIIEDTTSVKFGKYCLKYDGMEADYSLSGLDVKKNNWDDIDDFNYLASNSKSPNWTTVSADEQLAIQTSL